MSGHPKKKAMTSQAPDGASSRRSALVTGAASGLGLAIAKRLAAAGHRLILVDRDRHGVAKVARDLAGASAHALDITDERAVEAMTAGLAAAPDVLVNNAGIVRFGPLLEHSVADFRAVLDVNLVGAFIVTRAIARRMIARGGGGSIVNLTSLNAVAPSPDAGAYPASKAALALLTQHFALALGPHGIRVNAVGPGFIDAGMSAPIYADPEARARRSASVPLRSLGTAADVAEAVAYFASDAARYVTGQHLLVDGGVSFSLKDHLPRKAPIRKEKR
jgi:NAD(P)-dependent dehydrogenase (short-subunit alcohol dehydrogenase family)